MSDDRVFGLKCPELGPGRHDFVLAAAAERTEVSLARAREEIHRLTGLAARDTRALAEAEQIASRLREALQATKIVVTYWRDAFMEMDGPLRAGAHPLACALGALDGEMDPAEVGVKPESEAGKALSALRAHQNQEGPGGRRGGPSANSVSSEAFPRSTRSTD